MKISELVAKLQEQLVEHGDIEVCMENAEFGCSDSIGGLTYQAPRVYKGWNLPELTEMVILDLDKSL